METAFEKITYDVLEGEVSQHLTPKEVWMVIRNSQDVLRQRPKTFIRQQDWEFGGVSVLAVLERGDSKTVLVNMYHENRNENDDDNPVYHKSDNFKFTVSFGMGYSTTGKLDELGNTKDEFVKFLMQNSEEKIYTRKIG